MRSAQQLDLTSAASAGDPAPPAPGSRIERAAAAAEALAPRFGLTLPGAVQRALSGGQPRSAIEGIAAHIVRVVDALDGAPAAEHDEARISAVHGALPAVHGASPGIARAITAALVAPPAPASGHT